MHSICKSGSLFTALIAALALTACGDSAPPKTTVPAAAAPVAPAAGAPGAAPASAGSASAPVEAKKEEKHDAPDTHGMPGMADLFKGDDKKK